MRYILSIIQILGLLIFSCAPPKPPPVPIAPPASVTPKWIDGRGEDSLYLYSVASLDLGSKTNEKLESIAFRNLSELIEKNVRNRLQYVSDSTGLNLTEYMDPILETRATRSLRHMEIAEKYQHKNKEYVLARLDKKKYLNSLLIEKESSRSVATKIIKNLDNNISADNYTKIMQAIDTISMFLDYYPTVNDTNHYNGSKGIVDITRGFLQTYNDRVAIRFNPDYLEYLPLINESKRVKISAVDQVTGSSIKGIWVTARFSDSDINDLILTKGDGTILYQPKPIRDEGRSYVITFEVDYSAMMSPASAGLLLAKPKRFPITVLKSAPNIFFENIIMDLDDTAPSSPVVETIRQCFINKFSAIFVKDKKDSDMMLSLEVSTLEHKERVSDIYPYFVHASGSIILTDTRTNLEVLNQEITEQKGSDFTSIEKAGINALKNLAEKLGVGICD